MLSASSMQAELTNRRNASLRMGSIDHLDDPQSTHMRTRQGLEKAVINNKLRIKGRGCFLPNEPYSGDVERMEPLNLQACSESR